MSRIEDRGTPTAVSLAVSEETYRRAVSRAGGAEQTELGAFVANGILSGWIAFVAETFRDHPPEAVEKILRGIATGSIDQYVAQRNAANGPVGRA